VYPAILDELEAVLVDRESIPPLQVISPYQDKLSNDSKWKVFYLKAWGDDVQENCKRCPTTVEALKAIPGMTTAFFSIMEPNKEIPMHRGPYNGVLRYHLGVIVPERLINAESRWMVKSTIGEEVRAEFLTVHFNIVLGIGQIKRV
jgi:beta-hydroxylase